MNTTIKALIYGAGVYNVLFALFHLTFWKLKLFNWREELARMSPLNSGVMQIMNLCLIALFLIMAYVSFAHADGLAHSHLGKTILAGFSIFWLLRCIEQFIFFGYHGIPLAVLLLVGFILYCIPAAAVLFQSGVTPSS